MSTITNSVIFTAGRAIAFNVILPAWYAVIHIFGN